jgi:hypothetical protein
MLTFLNTLLFSAKNWIAIDSEVLFRYGGMSGDTHTHTHHDINYERHASKILGGGGFHFKMYSYLLSLDENQHQSKYVLRG